MEPRNRVTRKPTEGWTWTYYGITHLTKIKLTKFISDNEQKYITTPVWRRERHFGVKRLENCRNA
jgi:hypothetical protein